MLESIRLRNFRCFKDHTVPLKMLSVIVGANNAGKSTIVEALRLLSLVCNRYRSITYKAPPPWTELPVRCQGITPSTEHLDLRGGSIFHRYGDPPASIEAHFSDGSKIELLLNGDSELFGVVTDADGKNVHSKAHASRVPIPQVRLLPQIGPVLESEELLSRDYILKSFDTPLASRHFRNQLYFLRESHFEDFRRQAEVSWRGLHVEDIAIDGDPPKQPLNLLVRDGDFVAEIGWTGHGLQMWLQTMWFLARASEAETVILDEPDVYMHADLQRRLIRLLRTRDKQTIIATHSVEIMSEVSPDEILVVDKRRKQSKFAASLPIVQDVIDRLGGVQNIHLARLWGSRKCLHIEGDEVNVLKVFQDTLFRNSETSFLVLPRLSIGGWGGWGYAIGSTMALQNAAGEEITSYCIFDRDYHSDEEIEQRYVEAEARGVNLHIWHRKEMENYLLVSSAIRRIILADAPRGTIVPSAQTIDAKIIEIACSFREEVFDALAHEFLLLDRRGWIAGANQRARQKIEEAWKSPEGILALAPGKSVLSALSGWSRKECNVSFGALRVARELRREEMAPEVAAVVRAIELGHSLPKSLRIVRNQIAVHQSACELEGVPQR